MKRSIKFEAVGSRIEIIGGSIYPKEEGFTIHCHKCGAIHKVRLTWDQEACEFSLIVVPSESKEVSK